MAAEVLDATAVLQPSIPARPGVRPGKWIAMLVAALVGGLLIAGGIAAYETRAYAAAYQGRILPGITVAGVDLEGMTRPEAMTAVKAEIRPLLDHKVAVRWDDETWTVTPRDMGATSNAKRAAAAAVRASSGTTWLEWARMRWQGSTVDFSRDVAVHQPRQAVAAFVDRVAAEIDLDARDATLDYRSGWVEISADHDGRKLQQKAATRSIMGALKGGGAAVALPVATVEPEVTAAAYDEVLLLRQSERKLYLYQGGEITNEWTVAVGTSGYPTPTGHYSVTEKRYLPTWVNPDPTGWGASMPTSIGPGPGNPLGVRALNWSAPGAIRFHGTEAITSLGTAASHGCVRMSNNDVIQLYDLIDVGAAIVSI
ncbi:MAG: L,D-transpeptidase family protein [Egibacteraceae bacterium]